MKYLQKFISVFFILGFLLVACTPQTPVASNTDPTPEDTSAPALINAVYYRQGSGIFAERTGGDSLTMAHYIWLIPNGTVMTVITSLDQENGVCGDIYSISTTWNEDPDTVNSVIERATGTYSIEGNSITFNWDTYGVSYNGVYGQNNLSLDVNGHTEEFALASNASLDGDQVWFPEDCVYDQFADSGIPDPVIDPEPKLMNPFVDFYAAVMLDNGMLLLSFEGTSPIPKGNYSINIHIQGAEEEDVQTFKCQVLSDYPNRLYCHGSPLKVGAEYQISFVREGPNEISVQEAFTANYFEVRSKKIDKSSPLLMSSFDFSRISSAARELGINEVKTVGQAWKVVGACVQTYLGGGQLPESCQWFVANSLGLGVSGFEDPFFFDDPIIAFDDPIIAFDDPIIAFEDPFFFDDPIIAFEDPFFFDDPIIAFDDPIIAFEDPFFFDDPIIAFDDPIIAFDDPIIAFENPLTGWVSGITHLSNRSLGFNCGQALKLPYNKSLGTYTDQVYISALAQRQQGHSLPNACESLIVQCALTPGSGCFISPGPLGWVWADDGEPRTTGFDCVGENADDFYCQQIKYPEADLYATGRACGKEIKWGTPLRTQGHYADLMFYLASVAPWLTRESMPQTCVDFVMQGAHSLYGVSPLAIWGSNGTNLNAFGLPLIMTMPEPQSGAVLKPIVPGGGSSGGGGPINTCATPQPCGAGYYWDIGLCQCWAN